jgi:hypothetical protein
MGQVMMSIGDILFYRPYPGTDTPAFETLSRDMVATLPSQGRLGRDNAIQFTGPGEETISIHGRLFPYQFGGIDTMEQIRNALRAGKPLMVTQFSPSMVQDISLTSGLAYSGTKVGNYMIRALRKNNFLYTGDGVPMKIDFTMELVLYGDDLNSGIIAGAVAPPSAETLPAQPTPQGTASADGTTFNLLG